MAAPQIGCSTFGSWDFIRVPAPAARMTTAAGRLTVTWRCSLIDCCVAGRALALVSVTTGHKATRPFTSPTSRRIPSGSAIGGRHARGMTRITLLSVTITEARGNGASAVIEYPYQETRL